MPKYVVRHGVMRQLGLFSTRGRDRYVRGQRVIARTSRGQESGEVLCEATEHVQSQMSDPKTGHILRELSSDDEVELRKIEEQSQSQLEICKQRIAELGLDMELVDAEQLYGGERAVFYYLAEERVDFRELVKQLAKEFHTRIEMRQIGVRDEAKLLADYGDCGKPVCCNTHLSEMPPVSMKMAKLQKATLDPTKISGRCGRLKCCLRYEYDTYRGMQKELPKVGAEVLTNDGRAKVLAQEILSGQVLVQGEDMRRRVIDASEVLSVLPKDSGKSKKQTSGNSSAEAEGRKAEASKGKKGKEGKRSRSGRPSEEKSTKHLPETDGKPDNPTGVGPPDSVPAAEDAPPNPPDQSN